MNIVENKHKKRNGGTLEDEEIRYFVDGVKTKTIPDYQISALLMAIYFSGMDSRELASLTREMAYSGDRLSFPALRHPIVDKHSSGGVGDKTSLVIAPIVAACGLPIAKLSGRGLGFTGGTIDKLESIPGFRTEIGEEEFTEFVSRDGIAIIGQSADIAPVDKVLYGLRDVTGTVDSLPLIAASIMSKKLADGSDAIVLDVKYGSGAFMKTPEEAIRLAEVMVGIGEDNGKKTIALVTDMTQPLGCAVGNAMEVKEAIETLCGEGPADFKAECYALAKAMLLAGECAKSDAEAEELVRNAITSGRALQKFKAMVKNQGGEVSYVEDPSLFPKATYSLEGKAEEDGTISAINAETIGKSSLLLGAGRRRTNDTIDPAVGLYVCKKVGDAVHKGDVLFTVEANDEEKGREAIALAKSAYSFTRNSVASAHTPIYAIVRKDGVTLMKQDA